jgi:RimJ/RimL family protein N-acetyltransferase
VRAAGRPWPRRAERTVSRSDVSLVRLEGALVYLRPVRPSDVRAGYARWLNDPLINQFLESRFQKATEADLEAYVARFAADPDHTFLAVVARDTDTHIGNVKLGPIDRHHQVADMGLLIGDRAYWGRGIATEVIRLVSRYAFDELGLRKVTAGCYSTNRAAIRAFEKAGFAREGLRRKQYQSDGAYVDGVMLGLLRTDGMIGGSLVELGAFGPELITDAYLGWLNDRSLMRYSRQRFVHHTRESSLAYLQSFENTPNKFWAIYRRVDRLHIGTMSAYMEPTGRTADIGILVGHAEARARGYGREAWGLAMDYLFRVERVNKVTGGTSALNAAMVRVFRHWQMRLEEVQKDAEMIDGRPADVLRFGMLSREWEKAHPHALARLPDTSR